MSSQEFHSRNPATRMVKMVVQSDAPTAARNSISFRRLITRPPKTRPSRRRFKTTTTHLISTRFQPGETGAQKVKPFQRFYLRHAKGPPRSKESFSAREHDSFVMILQHPRLPTSCDIPHASSGSHAPSLPPSPTRIRPTRTHHHSPTHDFPSAKSRLPPVAHLCHPLQHSCKSPCSVSPSRS